jgi:zinc transporter 2
MSYIPEAHGTPMAVKTPINFLARKHAAAESNKKSMRKLLIVSFVSVFFIAVQITGGILSNSIAIFTDTAHLASDLVGFGISIISLTIAQRKSNTALSFGYHRAEVIGTLISVIGLQVLTLWLVYEATLRFFNPPKIDGPIMLATAILGLFFNLIQMKILHSGDGHYHLGGGHDHSHGDHDHGHDHTSHTHHAHSHGKKTGSDLHEGLINDEEHHHEHAHDHGDVHHHGEHEHAHEHPHVPS